jgi:hypothetical protein
MQQTTHVAIAVLATLTVAAPASAGHHQWDFSEIFSNANGTVQFIEMFSSNANEAGMNGATITHGAKTFTFVGNLPSSPATTNTWLLIATAGFAGSVTTGSPTPDYVLPDGFLDTGGGTLGYEGAQDTWNFPALPTDGVSSLERDLTNATTKLNGGSVAPTNSPTSFPTSAGSVVASAAVPSASAWGLSLLVGAVLLGASGMLRRRSPVTA